MAIRLLLSVRDPAAAYQMVEIARAALSDPHFDVHVVAQMPATAIMQRARLAPETVDLPYATATRSAEAHALLEAARRHLIEKRPDVILVGLSSPGDGGIDEAFLQERQVPAFLMQDFWGEQNSFFGRGADFFFVLDDEAARLSEQRHRVQSLVVGSPRHASYRNIDIVETRRRVRARLALAQDARVLGFFGQPLQRFSGYRESILAVCDAVNTLDASISCIYRPHPRESRQQQDETLALFARARVDVTRCDESPMESTLVACDAVCSILSNCSYDAAYMNWHARTPLLCPVSLLFEKDLLDYYSGITTLSDIPYFKRDLALPIFNRDELPQRLRDALSEEGKLRCWTAARAALADPARASTLILQALREEIED